jgi:hypothetical protein
MWLHQENSKEKSCEKESSQKESRKEEIANTADTIKP